MTTSLTQKVTPALCIVALLVLVSGCEKVPRSAEPTGTNAAPAKAHRQLPPRAPQLVTRPGTRHSTDAEDTGSAMLSPFDTANTAISNLHPTLLAAVQDAARQAKRDGVRFWITSGWRSRAHQQRLLDEAVSTYGSLQEALRWVSTPDTSAHVAGAAVDVGPAEADAWLEQHGAQWGLCRMFANERWHFERATRPGGTCPQMIPDSSYRQ